MKSWTQSKTVIVNGLSLAAGLLTVAVGSEFVAQYPRTSALLATTLAGVNVALRFITSVPIG